MNNLEKKFCEIESAIEEQNHIIDSVQDTKMYHVLQSIHAIRGKNKLFSSKREKFNVSIKHMLGKVNPKIQEMDPLMAVKNNGKIIDDNLNNIRKEYEKQLQFEELYKSITQRVDRESGYISENMLLMKIIQEKEKSICVMAPLENIDLPDGYSRRIKNIDMLLEQDMLRVYISKDYMIDTMMPIVEKVSSKYIAIKYNPEIEEHCIWVTMIAEKIGKVYIHSVYQSLNEIAKNNNILKIFDFHGVVPEELQFMGNDEGSKKVGKEEEVIIRNATYIVVANLAMKRHILRKYPECKSKFILLPMNNMDNDRNDNNKVEKNEYQKPIVIYSGGLQKWQLISEMQDVIEKRKDDFDFRIFVSDVKEYMKLWSQRQKPIVWRIETLPADELKKEYEKAHYGFVLRDEVIVNEVACPTKLIDYVKYGIVPIMKSAKIGDFVEEGLEYIPVEDFVNGKMPSEEKRRQMVQNNMLVMKKIYDEYKNGVDILKSVLEIK